MSGRTIVDVGTVRLCTETFGDRADPAILLIHGAATSMGGWGDRFCARLAASGRFVIRYDHRDTGESVSYRTGAPRYGIGDLIGDALGLLDAFGVDRAHLVGTSLGGGIALGAALAKPARVASLTLIGTSPGGAGLPAMSAKFLAHVNGPGPDFSDRAAAPDHFVALLRIFSADSGHFDEAGLRDGVSREWARTRNVASSQVKHFVMELGEPIRERLGEIGARLLVMKGVGHELPPAVWDVVVPAIVEHTARG